MNDFVGMEDLLSDFLMEAGDMLGDVDSKLMELEKNPDNSGLLNEIFRGFHTIKGGAGFLNATELVTLCHLTENVFDKLHNKELTLSAELMDVIFAATAEVRHMFTALQQSQQPPAAPSNIIAALKDALEGKAVTSVKKSVATAVEAEAKPTLPEIQADNIDWEALHKALVGSDIVSTPTASTRYSTCPARSV